MTIQEFFAANPDVQRAYQNDPTYSREGRAAQFLQDWSTRHPGTDVPNRIAAAGIDLTSEMAQEKARLNTGNTSIAQGGTQTGAYTSTGNTTQTGTTNQTSTGTTTGTQTQSGTNTQTGTSTTGVTDTLGFGELLKGQAGSAQSSDEARQSFLTDLVAGGGAGFEKQVQAAANTALSGPGMLGTGNEARGRVAGQAISGVARDNLSARLNATQQLAGPTAVQSLAGAGNPYLGQTSTINNVSVQDLINQTTGQSTQDTVTAQDMVTNENQSGTASGTTSQWGLGNQPVSSQKGGCYVSSVLAVYGHIGPRVIRRAVKYKLSNSSYANMAGGYSVWGPWLANRTRKSRVLRAFLTPACRAILYEELRWSGRRLPFKLWPTVLHAIFHYGCDVLGRLTGRRFGTADQELLKVMQTKELVFTWHSGYHF